MTGIGADHAHYTLATDDAAVLANATNGTTYFHVVFLYFLLVRVVEWPHIIPKMPQVCQLAPMTPCHRITIDPAIRYAITAMNPTKNAYGNWVTT